MVSRDTSVHIVAVLTGVSVLLLSEMVLHPGGTSTVVSGAIALLFYALVLGGSHLYLALRGEGGMVPVDARWRYVALIAVMLSGAAVALYGNDVTVASVELRTIGAGVGGLAVVTYFVSEILDGYRATRPE